MSQAKGESLCYIGLTLMKILSTLFCLLFLSPALFAEASAKIPSQKEFAKIYQRNLKELRKKLSADLQDPCRPDPHYDSAQVPIHFPSMIALSEFCATQSMYSFYKIALELGKSRPSEKTVDYVLYRGRRYLVDGHHHLLLSLYRGHEFISARVVAQFADTLTEEEFLAEMKKNNFVYDQLKDPLEMVDDPYLNKVREMVRDTELKNNKVILKGKKQRGEMIGALTPNKSYYSEQRLGEILEESKVPLKDIDAKKMIELFTEAQKQGDPRVEILVLLDKPINLESNDDFEKAQDAIREKMKKLKLKPRHCSQSLRPGTPP